MTSNLAIEDIEALIDEGCSIHPSDVIRLNALGLKSCTMWQCDVLATNH